MKAATQLKGTAHIVLAWPLWRLFWLRHQAKIAAFVRIWIGRPGSRVLCGLNSITMEVRILHLLSVAVTEPIVRASKTLCSGPLRSVGPSVVCSLLLVAAIAVVRLRDFRIRSSLILRSLSHSGGVLFFASNLAFVSAINICSLSSWKYRSV